ncbi:uncharacterized protein A4U43_C06F12090 [Asparagus officinalis]|uniref:Protein kinase domain-containing protein n=2 Tax=Asparagus officinalis TaxID=4686 RepID=A0A5P1ERZ3_ASPOF|nr:uncharacterized protein A4U43_C06F12090 [Asparagus officinalis]
MKLNILNLSSNDLSGEVPVQLQNQAYDYSFVSNPSLCSSNPQINIRICRGKSSGSVNLSTGLLILFIILGALFFIGAVVLGFFVLREYRKRKLNNDRKSWKMTSFHLGELNESNIAKGLTNENLIGSGGAGFVYKIVLGRRTGETIAVKRICNSRKMDSKLEKEFQAEVQILGSIRHANIVKLLCCISSPNSKLLVYEYMENGSLDAWLHSKRRTRGPLAVGGEPGQPETLDWPARLAIAVGAAKGLCYMHHGCSVPIVHRDVKASNILLDSEFNAKIADFGLARMLVKAGEPESVSVVAGSFGYMAPECGWSSKVNEKVDIFSFGVVLLELTTGREANHGDEHSCLADWAWKNFKEGGSLINLIDEKIRDPAYTDEIELVLRLGIICTGSVPEHRPSMKEVLQVLQRCERSFENRGSKSPEGGENDVAPLVGVKGGGGYGDDSCV